MSLALILVFASAVFVLAGMRAGLHVRLDVWLREQAEAALDRRDALDERERHRYESAALARAEVEARACRIVAEEAEARHAATADETRTEAQYRRPARVAHLRSHGG